MDKEGYYGMESKTISKEHVMNLLNDWYQLITTRKFTEAKELKKEIQSKINDMAEDQDVLIYFSLLDYRYHLLTEGLENTHKTIPKIEAPSETDHFLTFYYHFFKASHAKFESNYSKAKYHFKKAEMFLKNIPDEIEKANYNFKVSEFYYHIGKPLVALEYANKASAIFQTNNGYEIQQAGCKNVMGLSCILLKQFDAAKKYFLTALEMVKEDAQFTLMLRYNLGFLFSEQNQSQEAISHLTEIYNKKFRTHKVAFLLANEYYKLNQPIKAKEYIQEGLDCCEQIGNQEYKHHLNILHAFYSETDIEPTLEKAFSYFKHESLWGYIQQYAKKAALFYTEKEAFKKASYYLILSDEAEKNLLKKEHEG